MFTLLVGLDEEVVCAETGDPAVQDPGRHLFQPGRLGNFSELQGQGSDVDISCLNLTPQLVDELRTAARRTLVLLEHVLDKTP